MTERVQNAIDVFLDALNTRTLAKGSCMACAVGNLVAAGKNATIKARKFDIGPRYVCSKGNSAWANLFCTAGGYSDYNSEQLHSKKVQEDIQATDFSVEELIEIEKIFENNTKIHHHDYKHHKDEDVKKDQIKGLEAVVKVMLSFEESSEDVKEVFTKKAEEVLA